jgi:hypothetical protein
VHSDYWMTEKALQLINRRKNEQVHWRTQKVRRIFSVITAAVLIGALLGLFGTGPLSSVEARSNSGLLMAEYFRFVRMDAPTHFVLKVQSPDDRVDVRIENSYLNQFEVEGISPPPSETRLEKDQTVYVFDTEPGAVGEIKFDIRPQDFGMMSGVVTSSAGDSVTLRHFVYP